jgi:hypothetical protein
VLKEQDLVNRVEYPDATACTTWTIDLHYPDPKKTANFPEASFKSIAKHTTIYRTRSRTAACTQERRNLFMAGATSA